MSHAIQPSFSFRLTSAQGAEARPYYVMGEKGLSTAKVEELRKRVGDLGATVVVIDEQQRKEFNLHQEFQGVALLISKPAEGELARGLLAVYNTLESVIQDMRMDPDVRDLETAQALAQQGQTQLKGADRVLEIVQAKLKPEGKKKPEVKAQSGLASFAAQAAAEKERRNEIHALREVLKLAKPEQHLSIQAQLDALTKPRGSVSAPAATQVSINYTVPAGYQLFIRGEGAGLSWEKGIPVLIQDGQLVFKAPAGQDKPVTYKLLLNDSIWDNGDNHVLTSGKSVTLTPEFAAPTSIIQIKYTAPEGRTPFVRGEGVGLNWQSGTKMTQVGPDTWELRVQGFFESGSYKIVLDDRDWESGENHLMISGKTVEHTPQF